MQTEIASSIQARREGMSLSAWLRVAARERLEARQRVKLFESPEDVKEFSGLAQRWMVQRRTGLG